MNEALALHRQGRLREAEKIYTRVLKAAPDHFDALNLLGTIKAQLGRIGEAHRLLSAAVKLNPRAPQALGQSRPGAACAQAGPRRARLLRQGAGAGARRHRRPHQSRQRAVEPRAAPRKRSPRSARFWRGCRSTRKRGSTAASRTRRSARSTRRSPSSMHALTLVPGHPAAHFNRGVALYDLGRYADAVAAHDSALARGARSCRRAAQSRPRARRAQPLRRCASPATARRMRCARTTPTPISWNRWHCSRSATIAAALINTNGAGAAAAWPSRRAAAGRCGSAIIRWRARPCCCTPSRDLATPSSSRATCRSWPRTAPRWCSKCSRN